ncbi:hypothetical protein GH714_037582 [Hevea brasiliensis]|uniref:Pentacotripeptide-repeat region of PRORP domain-containing protein n=1 Tax=Hevea brasiliensis TaxID=3981 RepID=A0A6A6KC41_HEVBR|nr:hypothetical protein GH714_037582 [Hevea brasiliensis]
MLEEAGQCFSRMTRFKVLPKTRSCNALLHKLSMTEKGDFSRKFFKDMVGAGITPSVFTYNIMIGYMCKVGDMVAARSLFGQMKQLGLAPDVVTYNSLIDGYGSWGWNESVCLFEEMEDVGCEPDVITYNALINCFCKYEQMPKAFEFFLEMKNNGLKPNIITYSTLVDALCKEGMLQLAIKFLVDMRRVGLLPNEFTYTSLIDANCKAGNLNDALKLAKEIAGKTKEALNLMQEMCDMGIEITNVTFCVLVDDAKKLFDEMLGKNMVPDKIVYTALMHGNLKHWEFQEALNIRSRMSELGMELDLRLHFPGLGISQGGLVQQARKFLAEMIGKGIVPDEILCISLLRKYYELGNIDEAVELHNELVKMGLIKDSINSVVPNVQP